MNICNDLILFHIGVAAGLIGGFIIGITCAFYLDYKKRHKNNENKY